MSSFSAAVGIHGWLFIELHLAPRLAVGQQICTRTTKACYEVRDTGMRQCSIRLRHTRGNTDMLDGWMVYLPCFCSDQVCMQVRRASRAQSGRGGGEKQSTRFGCKDA